MEKRTVSLMTACLLALLLSACALSAFPAERIAVAQGPEPIREIVLVTAPPGATATPTPFQPVPPTAVYYPTDVPTPTPIPTPTPLPTPTEVPLPPELAEAAGLELPEGRMHILLLGSDQREREFDYFRTDSIILATLNFSKDSVSLTSFPRDLYVTIPGWGQDRINTAYARGGFRTLADTFEYNFGIRPDHYVLISFHTFNQFIDSLGGIDVNARVKFVAKRQGFGTVTIVEGLNHMDGKTALWYARSRKTSNDFSRARRQQEVLLAIAEKLISIDAIKRVPEFYELYQESVTTDLGLTDIFRLLPFAAKMTDTSRIHHYFIGPEHVYDWITPGGGMVLLPRQDVIQNTLRKAIKGKE